LSEKEIQLWLFISRKLGLGATYFGLGRNQEAIVVFKQAIFIKPDYAMTHFLLGLCYMRVGDTSSSLEEYKILKILDKDLANQLFNFIYQ